MKTKDRCGKLGAEPGMSLKIKGLAISSGNLIEKTGG
jgi:hypothetical protein